jgi:hypothetical protein
MRYKIWDKQEPIYTPVGEVFTAQQWLDKWPWAKLPNTKCVISAGPINGALMAEFSSFVEQYKKMGCPIDDAMTDEEILQAIEDFEDNPPEPEPTIEERAIALEEFKAMATVGYVPPKAIVEKNFRRGLWSDKMVNVALTKGAITKEDQVKIMGKAVENNSL